MHAYFVFDWNNQMVCVGTREQMKESVRKWPGDKTDLRVELRDVPTHKGNILELLRLLYSVDSAPQLGPVVRAWNVTARGGLKEIPIE